MAPSKTTLKDNRKKSGAPKRAKLDDKILCNDKLEKQIREEMERAQDQNMAERSESTMV